MSQSFTIWLKDLFAKSPKQRTGKRCTAPLGIEQLEDRVVPAINILDIGAGTLDPDLAADGIVNAANGTISKGVLASTSAVASIFVTCTSGDLTFNNLTTALNLNGGGGRTINFLASAGSIVFTDTADAIVSNDSGLFFNASGSITVGRINATAGSIDLRAVQNVKVFGRVDAITSITVLADTNADLVGALTVDAAGRLQATGVGATILVRASGIDLEGTIGADNVTLQQAGTAKQNIDLGGPRGSVGALVDSEPNNDFATAQALGPIEGVTTINGTGDNSFDVYSFFANKGETVKFETTQNTFPSRDTMLFLYDASGVQLALDDDSGIGFYSLLNYTFTKAGTYFMQVSAFPQVPLSPSDDYFLTITPDAAPWALSTAELGQITATTLRIGTLASVGAELSVFAPIALSNVTNLLLEADGNIADATNSEAADITAANLGITSNGSVGAGDALDIDADNLAVYLGSGQANIIDVDNLTIGTVASMNGISGGQATIAAAGTLTVAALANTSTSLALISTGGDINLSAVVTGAGSFTATTTVGFDILLGAAGSITPASVNLNAGGAAILSGTISTAGNVTVTAAESITVTSVVSGNNITVTATDAASAGQTITVASGATLLANGALVLNAGDAITVAGSLSGNTIAANVDVGNIDSAGGTINFTGASLSNAAILTLTGGAGSDTFTLAPQSSVSVSVIGGNPTAAPGDTLNLDLAAVTTPTLTPGSGGTSAFRFGNASAVTTVGVESYNFLNGSVALLIDMVGLGYQNGSPIPDFVLLGTSAGVLNVSVSTNGASTIFSGAATGISSITVFGSTDPEYFQIRTFESGLPPVTIHGNSPTAALSDTLYFDYSQVTNPVLTPGGLGAGTFAFGNRASIAFDGIEVLPPSIVSIDAVDPVAAERVSSQTPDSALYTLTRFGLLNTPLTLNYFASGTAVSGRDFTPLPGFIEFAAGSKTATLVIDARNNGTVDGTRTLNLSFAGTRDIQIYGSATATILDNDVPQTGHVVSTGAGPASDIRLYGNDPVTPTSIIEPFIGFSGGIVIARGDVNNDGVVDVAVGVAGGTVPHVKIFDGLTGAELYSFYAFDASYLGGVTLAIGDLDGDGYGEIIVGAAQGVAHVKVFSGQTGAELLSFFAYDDGQGNGAPVGVSVAAGDLDGDKIDEIVTGARSGPHIKVFDFQGNAIRSFFAFFPPSSYGGINIAVGDLNGDGKDDIAAANTFGIQSRLSIIDSSGVILNTITLPKTNSLAPNLAIADVDGDGSLELLVAVGPQISFYSGSLLNLDFTDNPYADYNGNIFVGA